MNYVIRIHRLATKIIYEKTGAYKFEASAKFKQLRWKESSSSAASVHLHFKTLSFAVEALHYGITFYMTSWLSCPKLAGLRANDFRCKKTQNIFLSDFSIKLGFTVVISTTKTYPFLNHKLDLPLALALCCLLVKQTRHMIKMDHFLFILKLNYQFCVPIYLVSKQ